MTADVPRAVRDAYALDGATLTPIASGWINRTLLVTRPSAEGEARAILQRLHPVFRGEVNVDIDACTARLASRGVPTPRVVPASGGALWVDAEDGPWRMLSYVPGRTLDALPSLAYAHAGGRFVARFHRALDGLEHAFRFTRPGAHDTPRHLAKLAEARSSTDAFAERAEADRLSDAILEAATALPAFARTPERIIHGDLKLTNLRFGDEAEDGVEVAAIVDLDTLARGSLAIDLGDMLRSWCNRSDESDPEARFDGEVFRAAMGGYLEGARGWIEPAERSAIVPAVETICLELAARFAADVYEDSYFGYDATRFASRRAHNLQRAAAQLALGLDVRRQRDALEAALG